MAMTVTGEGYPYTMYKVVARDSKRKLDDEANSIFFFSLGLIR